MSNYHIREIATDLKTVSCIFHIAIPTGNNAVGAAWRTALVAHKGGADAITSVLLGIPSADLTLMKAGGLLEHVTRVRFSSLNLTNAERLAEIETAYTATASSERTTLKTTLNFYGKSGDV